MALNDKRINFDINKRNIFNLTAKQYDTDGARSFTFRLLKNSIPFDLTGLSIKVGGKKPDGKDIFNDCKIKCAKKGIVELALTTQMQVVAGTLNLELIILKESTRLSTVPFEVKIIQSATCYSEVQSSDEFGALNNALDVTNEYSEKLKQGTEKIELQYANKLNKIDQVLKNFMNNGYFDVSKDSLNGFNFYVPYNIEEFGDYKKLIDYAEECSSNIINLCVRFKMKDKFDENLTIETEENQLKEIINYIKSKGMNFTIKIHINFNSGDVTNNVNNLCKWIENYIENVKVVLNWLRDEDIKIIYITNELSTITTEQYKREWEKLIYYIRNNYPNIKISSSCTLGELFTNSLFNNYDVIGVNGYIPIDGNKNSTRKELLKNVFSDYDFNRNYIDVMNDLNLKYNIPIIITEVGILPTWNNFNKPADIKKVDDDEKDIDAQTVYLDILLQTYFNTSFIKGVNIWCLTDGFTVINNNDATEIIKKYFKKEGEKLNV